MPETRPRLTILHTVAHPADAFDMAGGTLAHHVRDGDKVTVVVFTHGLHMCVPNSETFMRHYPEVRRRLPVSEHNLRIAQQPVKETCAPLAKVLTPRQPGGEA